jgi:hypothetical protein
MDCQIADPIECCAAMPAAVNPSGTPLSRLDSRLGGANSPPARHSVGLKVIERRTGVPTPVVVTLRPMRHIEEIEADEMVLAFLRAEAPAPRWVARYSGSGLEPEDIGPTADLADADQNHRRETALGQARGYRKDRLLFAGLPGNMRWYRGAVSVGELAALQHLNYRTFVELTRGSRRIGDGAANIKSVHVGEGLNESVLDLEKAINDRETYPPLIAVASSLDATPVVLEGNKRGSAYVRALPADGEVDLILGVAPEVSKMAFF